MKHCGHLCCTQLEHLTVRNGETTILKDINLHVHCGELTSLIGPNGAGKSTLLKTLIGRQRHQGRIVFCSETGTTTPVIGYVPQNLSFDADSPATVWDLFHACTGASKKQVGQMLDRVRLSELTERRLACLSGGELQRVLLGLALYPVPNLLLLDEPVSGVDQKGVELFWELLTDLRKQYDMTILIVSHHLSQVKQYSDRVVLLNVNVLANGAPDEVFGDQAFAQVFGKEVL